MIEGVGLDSMESIYSIRAAWPGKNAVNNSPSQTVFKDAANISPIGQLFSTMGQMNEQVKADFKEFLENIHNEFKSGNFDVKSITALASQHLMNFAESMGLDLNDAVNGLAELAQANVPLNRPPLENFEQIAENLINNLDENGDQLLNRDEFGIPKHIFDKMDGNSDGNIDKDEIVSFLEAGHKGKKANKGSKKDQGTTEQVTATFDTDGDGIADTEEVTTYGANGEVKSTENRPISSGSGLII